MRLLQILPFLVTNVPQSAKLCQRRTPSLPGQDDWPIGIRLDPLIYFADYEKAYRQLITQIGDAIDLNKIHSVTIGPCRLPKHYAKKIQSLYPDDPLIASLNTPDNGTMTYDGSVRRQLQDYVYGILVDHIPAEKIYRQFDNDERT